MLLTESNQVPVELLSCLKARYFVQSYRTTPVRLEIDRLPSGSYFLNLYISRMGDQVYRLLVEISESRLKLIAKGEMAIDQAFMNPENGNVFAALFGEDQKLIRLSLVSPVQLGRDNPVPSNLYLSFDLEEDGSFFDLTEHAGKRRKIVIELKSDSKILKSNLKYAQVRNILIPFSDLVKTALLDHNRGLTQKRIEDHLNFGYSYIGIGTLHSLLEINYHKDLFGWSCELENLSALFTLLKADDPDELLNALSGFKNRKIIPEYIRLLRPISKSGSGFRFCLATPDGVGSEVDFDWARAMVIKNIIESSLPEADYDEIVTGILTCLDFGNRKRPVFTLNSLENNQVYSGFIDPSLDGIIRETDFQFCRKPYECTIRVLFFPGTLVKTEQYRYTLLRIEEVSVN